MQNKTLLYVLIAFVAIFLIFDIFSLFARKPKYEVTFYQTKIEAGFSNISTITTLADLYFKEDKDLLNYKESYLNAASSTFIDYFKKISDEIGKNLIVISYKNNATERAGILEIKEIAVIKNLVSVKEDQYELSMGKLQMNSTKDSEFVVKLPENSKIISVVPTPTSIDKNVLKWVGKSLGYFPTVNYTEEY